MEPYVSLGKQSSGPVLCVPWGSGSLPSLNSKQEAVGIPSADLPSVSWGHFQLYPRQGFLPPWKSFTTCLLDQLFLQPVDEWWASWVRLQFHQGKTRSRIWFRTGRSQVMGHQPMMNQAVFREPWDVLYKASPLMSVVCA